jgi:sugar phosphate isomerase/epimerase
MRSSLGLAYTSYAVRMLQGRDIMQATAAALPATTFVELCAGAGAGGCQIDLSQITARDDGSLGRLREQLDAHGLFVELSAPPTAFLSRAACDDLIVVARALGATHVRTPLLMGRRYESFATPDDWRAFQNEWFSNLDRMAWFAGEAGLVLAVENHKDWTAAELDHLVGATDSVALGICVDFGNNVALLEDPLSVVEHLAPLAVTTHVKDIAVRATDEGLEMAEVPLGQGILPLARMVDILRQARPDIRFILEMITRDPLPVPFRTERYWTTRDPEARADAERVAADLLRSSVGSALPRTSGLSADAASRLEDDHNRACLDYARASLGL